MTQVDMGLNVHAGPAVERASYWYEGEQHFPCEGCDYCDLVRDDLCERVFEGDYGFISDLPDQYYYYNIVGSERRRFMYKTTGRVIGDWQGNVATYDEYMALPEGASVNSDDIIVCRCDGCGERVLRYYTNKYNGYCSDECRDENVVVAYCTSCDNAVDYAGDLCDTCSNLRCYSCRVRISRTTSDEYDHHCRDCYYYEEYDETGYLDDVEYTLGDIVPVHAYGYMDHCWIDRDGNARYVGYCKHQDTAIKMGFDGVSDAERNGWIHVSSYWSSERRFVYVPDRPTSAQFHTMRAYADAVRISYTQQLQDWVNQQDAVLTEIVIGKPYTYEVTVSCLPRRQRDLYYPLSGD